MGRRKLVAGNWKMHGLAADLGEVSVVSMAAETVDVDVALCLPATLIERAVRKAPGFAIGGQDVHQADKGAHTGCISAAMLLDTGARLTIVGHSERREAQHETDADVKAKAEAALAAGLDVILCVGESDAVREAGTAVETVSAQLDASLPATIGDAGRFSIAYEPIWAIGTGKVPSTADIGEMHAALRARLVAAFGETGNQVRILYGGSVKASNAAEIFAVADVDGALVGGASLTSADFLPIVEAAAAS
jgi:triosephosphate isomerase (TIM)